MLSVCKHDWRHWTSSEICQVEFSRKMLYICKQHYSECLRVELSVSCWPVTINYRCAVKKQSFNSRRLLWAKDNGKYTLIFQYYGTKTICKTEIWRDTVHLLTHVLCKLIHFFSTHSEPPWSTLFKHVLVVVWKTGPIKNHVCGTTARSPSRSNSR